MVFNKNEDTSTIPDEGESSSPEMAEIIITENGVRKLLQKLDGDKATGHDDIPARLLKETATEITPMLTTLLSPVKMRGYRVELVRLSVRLSVPLDIGYFVHASLG